MTINPILARFMSEPALVEPTMRDRFEASLNALVEHPAFAQVETPRASAGDDFWTELGDWSSDLRPYKVEDGVLQIPVKGVLLHDFPYTFFGYATGYAYIQRAFERGCADANVRAIAFIIDSPGGMVAGCFDAVDKMVAAKNKPVRAFAHEGAYSAAYAVATVADHIAVSRTGGVGSIGVVTMHMDVSGAMEQRGVKITFIASDPSKVEGNPYEALGPDAKERIKARIDELYAVFVATVARSRGLEESAIRDDLKAYCYTATQSVANGLADSIGSLDDAVAAFAASLDDQSDNTGEDEMAEANQSAVDQAAHDAAVAAARDEGRAEGATAERTRIGAILGSDEATGRESLAQHFAFKTGMSADDAVAALAASPKAEVTPAAPAAAAAPAAPFDAAMQNGNPEVGAAPQGGNDDNANAESDPNAIRALAASIGLKGFGK